MAAETEDIGNHKAMINIGNFEQDPKRNKATHITYLCSSTLMSEKKRFIVTISTMNEANQERRLQRGTLTDCNALAFKPYGSSAMGCSLVDLQIHVPFRKRLHY